MITPLLRLTTRSSTYISVRGGSVSAAKSVDLSYLYRDEGTATPPSGVSKFVYNRNPRNLERLRIAYQFDGYHLDKPGRKFWHKLFIKSAFKKVSASIIHNTEYIPITASTGEWCISKFLTSKTDKNAYILLGKVLARRCLESGITEVTCFYDPQPNTKLDLFLKQLEIGGISLTEPEKILWRDPKTLKGPEKSWEILDE